MTSWAALPPPTPPHLEVFLSHSSKDAGHVRLVTSQISSMGIKVYLAEHDPKPGGLLADKIDDAIERCSAFVVLITPNSLESNIVQHEIGIARGRQVPMVPIVEVGMDKSRLGILDGIEYLELDPANPSEALARITASLQPLVLKQLRSFNLSISMDDPATVALVFGLGFLVASLILSGGRSD